MKIRYRLFLIFVLLMLGGVTATVSYSILVIRNYLVAKAEATMRNDTQWLALSLADVPDNRQLGDRLRALSKVSRYHIAVFDSTGRLLGSFPESGLATIPDDLHRLAAKQAPPKLVKVEGIDEVFAYAAMPAHTRHRAAFIQVSQKASEMYAAVREIRWIIYSGMFATLGLVLIASYLVARSLTRPILRLQTAANQIAAGHPTSLDLGRSDEFGDLARALTQMANQLQAESTRLRELNARQAQFYSDITHELRNPLHTLLGALELLELDQLPPEQARKTREMLRTQALRMKRLFEDLLTLQKTDADSQFVRLQATDLQPIVTQAVGAWAPEAAAKGLVLTTLVPPGLPLVLADASRLEQVLDNLLSNAVKYTPSGSITLRLTREAQGVRIAVQDTGPGIAPEHQPHLFDRFYRTDSARTRDTGGTGLGLAVARDLTRRMGSDLHLNSRLGKGSEFWFVLKTA